MSKITNTKRSGLPKLTDSIIVDINGKERKLVLSDLATLFNDNLDFAPVSTEQYAETSISAAQIRTFYTLPIELLPALTAGSYYSDIKIIIEFAAGTVGFDTSDKTLYVFWGTSYIPVMGVQSDGFLWATSKNLIAESSSPFNYDAVTPDNIGVGYQSSTTPEALVIGTWADDGTGGVGNGTMLVKVWYTVKTLGTEL